jgi:hypothetical protein
MKKLKYFLLSAMAAGIFAGCSSDDDNGSRSMAGTYELTAVDIPKNVDFNGDETASSNLITESVCYENSYIELNSDNTYSSVYNYVLITTEVACESDESTGTWEVSGDKLILTNTMIEPPITIEYDIRENDEITLARPNSPYPDRDAEGNAIYSTGNVSLTYTKM